MLLLGGLISCFFAPSPFSDSGSPSGSAAAGITGGFEA